MDAQFVNYEEPYSYTNIAEKPSKNVFFTSKAFADSFENQNLQAHNPTTKESYWQRMKRFFSRTKPTKKQRLPRQQKQINPYDQFEDILNICAQKLSSDSFDATAILQSLTQLYTYNLQYIQNPRYNQAIENLLNKWVAQLITTGRKAFAQCQIHRTLTSEFMAFLFSIDYFLSQATIINHLQTTKAYQDLVLIVQARFIDWFKILLQIPGINLERLFNTINECWGRFRSAPMKQLMIRVADMCNNARRRIY